MRALHVSIRRPRPTLRYSGRLRHQRRETQPWPQLHVRGSSAHPMRARLGWKLHPPRGTGAKGWSFIQGEGLSSGVVQMPPGSSSRGSGWCQQPCRSRVADCCSSLCHRDAPHRWKFSSELASRRVLLHGPSCAHEFADIPAARREGRVGGGDGGRRGGLR